MKPPKNFMKFPYNLLKKTTIAEERFEKKDKTTGYLVIELEVKDTWLMKLIKKILKYEEQQ